ncbi:MAG: glycine cleavage system aminomethyltransferase GcvT [Candidatus Heimdallarchaeota archaeon]
MPMKTQLYDYHKENGDMINFAGFQMPVMYSSIQTEHMAVRNSVGLFDVSHMGRMWIEGSDADVFINYLTPRDLNKTLVGRASYTFMLNEQGGFKDDLVFERIEENKWLLVWNAGNLRKIELWIRTVLEAINKFSQVDVSINNISNSSAMFALQGPLSPRLLSTKFTELNPPSPWNVVETTLDNIKIILSGTGYTGERGYEIIVFDTTPDNPSNARKVWDFLLEPKNADISSIPCGLGARDSLRLEAGYCLYGNDINENLTPVEADLFFPPFIHMNGPDFVGKQELKRLQDKDPDLIRIGLKAAKKGPSPRSGVNLYHNTKKIGHITSGGFSPLLQIGVGMGYVYPEVSDPGTLIQYEIRGKFHDAQVATFPLFDPQKFGSKRQT